MKLLRRKIKLDKKEHLSTMKEEFETFPEEWANSGVYVLISILGDNCISSVHGDKYALLMCLLLQINDIVKDTRTIFDRNTMITFIRETIDKIGRGELTE